MKKIYLRLMVAFYIFMPASIFAQYSMSESPVDVALPVELIQFNAEQMENSVVLNWSSASEVNNLGYIIKKQYVKSNELILVSSYEFSNNLKSVGNSNSQKNYEYTDNNIQVGDCIYFIYSVDKDGEIVLLSDKNVSIIDRNSTLNVIKDFEIISIYPNPFNGTSHVNLKILKEGVLKVEVYNILGQVEEKLFNGFTKIGSMNLKLDANNLHSGLYIVSIQLNNTHIGKKVLYLK